MADKLRTHKSLQQFSKAHYINQKMRQNDKEGERGVVKDAIDGNDK